MPNTFQRPMFMSFCPPFTEAYLQEEKDDTDEHTDRITAVRSQIQADREIDQRTEKGLRHVIRQTHLPIRAQDGSETPKALPLVQYHESGDQYKRESEFLPHIKDDPGCLTHDSAIRRIHQQYFQLV